MAATGRISPQDNIPRAAFASYARRRRRQVRRPLAGGGHPEPLAIRPGVAAARRARRGATRHDLGRGMGRRARPGSHGRVLRGARPGVGGEPTDRGRRHGSARSRHGGCAAFRRTKQSAWCSNGCRASWLRRIGGDAPASPVGAAVMRRFAATLAGIAIAYRPRAAARWRRSGHERATTAARRGAACGAAAPNTTEMALYGANLSLGPPSCAHPRGRGGKTCPARTHTGARCKNHKRHEKGFLMRQRGRKSASSLEVAARYRVERATEGARPSERGRGGHLGRSDGCHAFRLLHPQRPRCAGECVLPPGSVREISGWLRKAMAEDDETGDVDQLLKMRQRETAAANSCLRALRLTKQAQLHQRTAANASAEHLWGGGDEPRKPWERA